MTATAAAYSSGPLGIDDTSLAAYSALLATTFGAMPLPYVRWRGLRRQPGRRRGRFNAHVGTAWSRTT